MVAKSTWFWDDARSHRLLPPVLSLIRIVLISTPNLPTASLTLVSSACNSTTVSISCWIRKAWSRFVSFKLAMVSYNIGRLWLYGACLHCRCLPFVLEWLRLEEANAFSMKVFVVHRCIFSRRLRPWGVAQRRRFRIFWNHHLWKIMKRILFRIYQKILLLKSWFAFEWDAYRQINGKQKTIIQIVKSWAIVDRLDLLFKYDDTTHTHTLLFNLKDGTGYDWKCTAHIPFFIASVKLDIVAMSNHHPPWDTVVDKQTGVWYLFGNYRDSSGIRTAKLYSNVHGINMPGSPLDCHRASSHPFRGRRGG